MRNDIVLLPPERLNARFVVAGRYVVGFARRREPSRPAHRRAPALRAQTVRHTRGGARVPRPAPCPCGHDAIANALALQDKAAGAAALTARARCPRPAYKGQDRTLRAGSASSREAPHPPFIGRGRAPCFSCEGSSNQGGVRAPLVVEQARQSGQTSARPRSAICLPNPPESCYSPGTGGRKSRPDISLYREIPVTQGRRLTGPEW